MKHAPSDARSTTGAAPAQGDLGAEAPTQGRPGKGRGEQAAAERRWPVYVGRSARHGRGLFAARRIPADTLILPIEGVPTEEDGRYVLWCAEGKRAIQVTNEARFVNHSSDPNAAYYEDGVWSLREIAKDEEITHDYGEAWAGVD